MKRFVRNLLLCALLSGICAAPAGAATAELIYDGNFVRRAAVKTLRGMDYIHLKAAAALFKGNTQWYPVAGKIVFQVNNRKITFNIGSRAVQAGPEKMTMEGPVVMLDEAAYVPVDFFLSKTFSGIVDADVGWNGRALSAHPRVTLLAPRVYSRFNATRVVLEGGEPLSPRVSRRGNEVTAEIPRVTIAEEDALKVNDKVIEEVRLFRARKGAVLKIVLAKDATGYSWNVQEKPPRLTVEVPNPHPQKRAERMKEFETAVSSAEPARAAVAAKPEGGASASAKTTAEPPPARGKSASHYHIGKIVVDAGHGGEDPGAVGRGGTKEKEINLAIALELARTLRMEGGYDVVLTRTDDTFIPLHDRSLFANEQRADLFISIHCNASIRRAEGGFEIYFLAEDASDPHAEATAEFENAVVELESEHVHKGEKLQSLLSSMARNEFINESSLLCHTIERSFTKRVPIASRGVKQANFHVLHGVAMPSVLVETAFLTRQSEEQKLRQRKFRSSVVDAILVGVQNYEEEMGQAVGR